MENTEIIEKNAEQNSLNDALQTADQILQKSYLSSLSKCEIVRIDDSSKNQELAQKLNSSVRFFDITKIVLNKNENMRDKLVTVFNAVWNTGSSILFQIKGTKEKVSISIGIKNPNGNVENTALAQNVLRQSLSGNFPGTEIGQTLDKTAFEKEILDNFNANLSVSAVTDVAGLRSEEESKEKLFMQGIEKLVDAMQGQEYTLFLIADAVSLEDLNANRRALENIYSNLVPLSESSYSLGQNESDTVGHTIGTSVTETVSQSIAESVSHTTGKSYTQTSGSSKSETVGTNESTTDGTNTSKNFNPGAITTIAGSVAGAALGSVVPGVGTVIGGMIGGVIGGFENAVSFSNGKNHSVTKGTSRSDSYSENESYSESSNESDTTGETKTSGKSSSSGTNESDSTQHQTGESKNIQIKFENHTIKQMMKRIDKILERYDSCADFGMWNCAVYCIADKTTSQVAANIFRSIVRGKNSALESSGITTWTREETPDVMDSLRHMEHPRVKYGNLILTPGTLISSAELAIEAGLPNHSLPGLPVIECAEFGRTVSSYDEKEKPEDDEKIQLGKIYHMHSEEKLPVTLNINSLASHTFITGSTGSGKSFTVYQMLSRLAKETAYTEKYTETKTDENGNVVKDENGKPIEIEKEREVPYHFLVIEPAKGEYKNEFGKYADEVYGTNPKFSQLLRINPFSFYGDTHILEHLDRLIEIFNVCWPMYAAMPAVLKEAVEKSYEDCGWDLALSENKYGDKLFPTFSDVTRNIRSIIDSSDYDSDNKGAYKGSLITRLKSLSNGINGQIFSDDEIPMEDLFEKNVIVDLSRVGSAETKSLIMGLLVLKLQEYRMNQGASKLKHVTVLEEAHNLLKRTSTEQSSESANLLGKSVEMLTNSIAEMRAFGEGFIIADQAPGLLDMAVIRNTNTKIILRLPDQSDRELVGKAAGLNDDQIKELAKLPCGVAAVYQNEWIEPVLCKVDEFTDKGKFEGKNDEQNIAKSDLKNRLEIAKLLCSTPNEPVLLEDLKKLHLGGSVIAQYLDYKNSAADKPDFNRLSQLVSSVLFEFNETVRKATLENSNAELWRDRLSEKIDETFAENQINDENEELKRNILQCILQNLILNELKKPELLKELNPRGGAR